MHKIKMLVLTTMVTCLFLSSLVAYGAANELVYITGVTPVPGITVDWFVPYEDVIAALPSTTTISLSNGSMATVTLNWISITDPNYPEFLYSPDSGGIYTATATFELPEGVSQPDPPIPLQVTTTVLQRTSLLPGNPTFGGAFPLTLAFPGFNQPGTYGESTLMIGGVSRTYYYYVPTSYDGTKPVPLAITLHGAGSSGLAELLGGDEYAEKYGYILVCPTYSITYLTAFASAIIDKMAADYNIDTRRVYACGISMGGIASAILARYLSDKIAAVGLISGGSTYLLTPLPRPMTVIMFGGSKEFAFPHGTNLVPGMLAAANVLVQQYHCDPDPEITEWPATADDPRTSVTRYAWSGGIYGTEVIVYAIWGGGHAWPGGLQYLIPSHIGWVTTHVDAKDELWEHFKKHAIPEQVDIDIKPGSCPNAINLGSQGVIPVAILTTNEFDATTVDAQTVRFGREGWEAKPVHYALEDVDKDGKLDMILHFRTQETGIQAGDTSATLTGRSFFGTDSIRTV